MLITLSEKIISSIGIEKLNGFNITVDSLNWKNQDHIDLNKFTDTEVKKLEELLVLIKDIYGVKTLLQTIKIWRDAKQDVSSVLVPKLIHFEELLFTFIKNLPHHWLFERLTKEADAMVAYYISDIKYYPICQRRDYSSPEHVIVSCLFEKYGKKRKQTFTFYSNDVCKKRIRDILLKFDLFPENEELLSQYHKEIGRYSDLIPQIGKQFTVMVTGMCTDKVPNSYRYGNNIFTFSDDRRKNRVVIDTFTDKENEDDEDNDREQYWDETYWQRNSMISKKEEEDELENEIDSKCMNIPIHPFVVVFDLFRHLRLSVHINYLKEYIYDCELASKLILPEDIKSLIQILVEYKASNFKDIVAGKGGGAIILLTGAPGVGKTLTAEVFAETDKKPLYSVQASQLGTDPKELEEKLMMILQRTSRWNAIMLLDEADVYVHERGNDLIQNAIVGVFLRVLEYHSSVLFLTTNRPELVDDAIASRCVARIDYLYPDKENQKRIWKILSETSSIVIDEKEYSKFVDKDLKISGRDIKNLLKLANLISKARKEPITCETIEYVLKFKPTVEK